jgi:hypothetical protein
VARHDGLIGRLRASDEQRNRLRASDEQRNRQRADVRHRTILALLDLAGSNLPRSAPDGCHGDCARHSATTRRSRLRIADIRHPDELRRAGLITTHRGRIDIVDSALLVTLARQQRASRFVHVI